ncbi:MAG: type II secretion system protein GspE, partial [Candidatus Aenigmatarchaeota archaeon]
RTGIYELLIVDEDIRNLIKKGVDSSTIRREAISKGMVGLRKDGGRKVLEGITSAEEVFRVTQEEAFL